MKRVQYPYYQRCTDNAAMIGAAGYYLYKERATADLALNGFGNMDIELFSQ